MNRYKQMKKQKHSIVIELIYYNPEKLNQETLVSIVNNLSCENVKIQYKRESRWRQDYEDYL
tara:strand:+ start:189 stop:374 length:186 start_codon:yes stop_codon:yes gene_type:complete